MGKPYFADSGWHFSISHTKGHAFCVLADVPVGLDAEEADRKIRLSLAPKILSSHELRQFAESEDPRRSLLTFWVLKEAQAKLTGEGMKWHPTHTDFTLPDSRVREIDGCLVAIVY
jgi:4'-phosphopantetheinyl transferase